MNCTVYKNQPVCTKICLFEIQNRIFIVNKWALCPHLIPCQYCQVDDSVDPRLLALLTKCTKEKTYSSLLLFLLFLPFLFLHLVLVLFFIFFFFFLFFLFSSVASDLYVEKEAGSCRLPMWHMALGFGGTCSSWRLTVSSSFTAD